MPVKRLTTNRKTAAQSAVRESTAASKRNLLRKRVPGSSKGTEGVSPRLPKQRDDNCPNWAKSHCHQQGCNHSDRDAKASHALKEAGENPAYCEDLQQPVGRNVCNCAANRVESAGLCSDLIDQDRGPDHDQNAQSTPDPLCGFYADQRQLRTIKKYANCNARQHADRSCAAYAPMAAKHQ